MTTPATPLRRSACSWDRPADRRLLERGAAAAGSRGAAAAGSRATSSTSPLGWSVGAPLTSSPRTSRIRALPMVAAEPAAPYDAAADPDEPSPAAASGPGQAAAASGDGVLDGADPAADALATVADLAATAARVAALDTDALTHAELEGLVEGLQRPMTQLDAVRARAFADLERRAIRQAPSHQIAGARDEQRRRNAEQNRLSRSDAKRAAEAGRAATDHAATGAAFREGRLGTEHARIIGDTLHHVSPDRRDEVEDRLLSLAEDRDPNAFGRAARELLGKEAPANAAKAEQRQHLRRSVRMADTADGGFAFSGLLYGTAAEAARTAIHAFRKPDTPGEHRTPEQRNADAFEQLCEVALRAGDAPTQHGVRPHILVIVEEADLLDADGTARLGHSGQPITMSSLQHLLTDATVSRLVRNATGTPIEASEGVRTVPKGLWRALLARDGGCTWDGCDAPPSWCDVAHGHTAFHKGGILSPANAALLCRRHHRRFDANDDILLAIDGDHVTYLRRTGAATPAGERSEDPATAADQLPATHPPDPPPPDSEVTQAALPLERDPPEPPEPDPPDPPEPPEPPEPEHPPG